MDEQLFYIESNIPGIWENERYSLSIMPVNEGGNKLLSITNKEFAPKTGYSFVYFINKVDFDYILTMVDTISHPIIATKYKIYIDAAEGKLSISVDGASWDFKKVV